jgi:DNA-binding response OmpR family regulator
MAKRILIIEDDTFLRELYQEMLTDSGYEVDVALDGEEGLNKINSQDFNLILLECSKA